MYTSYFGFREKPFNVTPNPRLFYTNPVYQEAYAALLYGIRERKGFVVLTGEVGTGKTTLLRRLMDNLEATVRFVFIYNTSMTFDEILSYACDELGLTVKGEGLLRKIQALNEFLIEQLRKGGTGVLLVDEAQNLADEVLENLRLLSNLETKSEKLLQIVLVGQPELEDKLDQPRLRQIKQRIAVRYKLGLLKEREIGPFIDYRLRAVGYERPSLFPPDAIRQIALCSKGVPRLINIICDNALLIAYAASAKKISASMIQEVARDLHLESGVQSADLKVLEEDRIQAAKAAAGVPKVIRSREEALRIVKGQPQEEPAAQFPDREPANAGVKSVDETVRAWSEKILQGLDELGSNSLARFAVGVFLAILLLGGVASATLQNKDRMQSLSVQAERLLSLVGERFGILRQNLDELLVALSSGGDDEREKIEASLTAEPSIVQVKKTFSEETVSARREAVSPESRREPASGPNIQEIIRPETNVSTPSHTASLPVNWKESPVVVKNGSTIQQIAADLYGPKNLLLGMSLIKEFNPQISNLDWVSAGEGLWVPSLSRETLLRKQRDGSYRLILESFGSIMRAVERAQAVRSGGYQVAIVPQRVSDNLLLHRVEISGLENSEAVDQAWETAMANRWIALAENSHAGGTGKTATSRP